ncbi:unnamed protein product [Prorocentrum cordatum]|uniref:Uncharacterized protein n=1 Tax=Prorocentrum cordatum TaxID=2364126 RepID=A0ABN9U3L2_9DINO|nr:unnamed protein product [Polarella glacialis]
MLRTVVRACRPAALRGVTTPVVAQQARFATTIKIMDEKAKAACENLYWAAEDERLLKKMLESHPELDPKYQGISAILDEGDISYKVKMIFMKHGIPPVNKESCNSFIRASLVPVHQPATT